MADQRLTHGCARSRLLDQRPGQINLTGSGQLLQFGGSRLVENGAQVNVQGGALTVGHFANVALPRLVPSR
jgi:hypothetical protein